MLRYFVYCRKSTESEDRQVLSLESQLNELKDLARRLNLSVIDTFIESKSAKSPGRPLFDEMIKRINQNKADGIICWKLDRLSRNPIDGGQIIWLLQKNIIKHIQTFDRGYLPEDNVLLMNVEFGMANQFILDLGRNVKRGLKTKAEKGWLPSFAPIGYLNDKSKGKGFKEIAKDPERFELVKRMWQLMLTGQYTPTAIIKIAHEEWGILNPKNRLISRSTIYKVFTSPFYYGWYEYPVGSGNWHQGRHEPMITAAEYDHVQILLAQRGKPRRLKKLDFSFTGILRCGECGGTVTAEDKRQVICSECKYKFSTINRWDCPKCNTPIEKMKKPTFLHYVYYHCAKRVHPNCTQGSIEVNELEKQFDQYLSSIHISEGFKNWGLKYLKEIENEDRASREDIILSQKKAHANCLKKLDNLFQLKISPLNITGSLLSDEEFAKQKTELLKEKVRLEESLNGSQDKSARGQEVGANIFEFARSARSWFVKGTPQEKSRMFQTLGSNLILRDKRLSIQLKKPFLAISHILEKVPAAKGSFEPKKMGQNGAKMSCHYFNRPIVSRELDNIRTWIRENLNNFTIPSFKD
jgi:site-specific DNA recombinase